MADTSYKFEVGKWYKTRNGLSAQISDDTFKGPHGECFAGKIQNKFGDERLGSWRRDGRWSKDRECEYDLMPPVETEEFWLNVYPQNMICKHKSKSLADEHAGASRIGLLKITITGDDYTVEKVEL